MARCRWSSRAAATLRLLFTECTDSGRLRGLRASRRGGGCAGRASTCRRCRRRRWRSPSAMSRPAGATRAWWTWTGRDWPVGAGRLFRALRAAARAPGAGRRRTTVPPACCCRSCPPRAAPDAQGDADGWDRVQHLTATLSERELLELPVQDAAVSPVPRGAGALVRARAAGLRLQLLGAARGGDAACAGQRGGRRRRCRPTRAWSR